MTWKTDIKKEANPKAFDLVNDIQSEAKQIQAKMKELDEKIHRLRGMLIMQ
tara:strand:- start:44 stop:196 length:153 start_codon:yes stop_codon:yes gene_type:complete